MKAVIFIFSALFIVSCSSEKSNRSESEKKVNLSESLLNLHLMYSDAEQNISFPIWFNDSIIKAQGILKIKRSLMDENDSTSTEFLVDMPKRNYEYLFGKSGELKQMLVSNFYDNKIISTIKVVFSKHSSFSGFAHTSINDELDYDHKEFPFLQMKELSSKNECTVFKDLDSENRLFIVRNENLWKPLSIDTLCKPNASDILILGDYRNPTKKYKVKNIVEETDVRNYTSKNNRLESMEWKDAPFEIKRSFEYAHSGQCIGFIDSTFSMSNFVSAMYYRIELKNNLPISITRSVFRDTKEIVLFKEIFEYEFSK